VPSLPATFFDRDPLTVARDLVGKVLRRKLDGLWLSCAIVETEAYSIDERGSHASLGRTPSREALWAPPGTVYMYSSRGGDSLNISCRGDGNAVLIKAGLAVGEHIDVMQRLNPIHGRVRPAGRLCSGQTLVARSLGLRVPEWTGRPFDVAVFHLEDVGYRPSRLVRTTRLGIPAGRDQELMWRYVDADRARHATSNPLTKRAWREGIDYAMEQAMS
jgi:DNA-3-methyladenine glycosylase